MVEFKRSLFPTSLSTSGRDRCESQTLKALKAVMSWNRYSLDIRCCCKSKPAKASEIAASIRLTHNTWRWEARRCRRLRFLFQFHLELFFCNLSELPHIIKLLPLCDEKIGELRITQHLIFVRLLVLFFSGDFKILAAATRRQGIIPFTRWVQWTLRA